MMIMNKINIKTTITIDEEKIQDNVSGSFINGIISYQEKDGTYVYLDINKDELIRENDELVMKYIFNKNRRSIGNVFIKDINKNLELEIETKNIKKQEHNYYVEYKIEENKFIYELLYTEE